MKQPKEDIIKFWISRIDTAKTDRAEFEAHCQAISDVILPFGNPFTSEAKHDRNRMINVTDPIGLHSNQLFASGVFSMMTSPSQKWFIYTSPNKELLKNREVKLHFDAVTEITYHEINRPIARFNASGHECYLEFGAYGNFVMFVTEHLQKQALNFISLPLSDCYFGENPQGTVDTLYRRYTRSVKFLIDKFGKDNVHEKVADMYDKKQYDKKIKCFHIIAPNSEFKKEIKQPFMSMYIDINNKHVMQLKGYSELPIMVPRMYKSTGSPYAWGPGSYALPAVNMCQEIMRTTIRAAQKVTDPPLQVPDEGFLNPPRVSPSGLNYYRAGTQDRIEPLKTGAVPGLGMDLLESIYTRIEQIFFADQLQLAQGPQMTATEVIQRTEEKLRIMGPILGALTSEYLGPMLNRVYGILKRMGKYPKLPDILKDQPYTIEYTSPIARAQEQVEANGLLRTMQVLSPFIQADPFIMDNYDGDELANGVSNMFSVSAKYLRSKKDVKKKREERQEMIRREKEGQEIRDRGQGIEALSRAGMNLETMDLEGLGGIVGQ